MEPACLKNTLCERAFTGGKALLSLSLPLQRQIKPNALFVHLLCTIASQLTHSTPAHTVQFTYVLHVQPLYAMHSCSFIQPLYTTPPLSWITIAETLRHLAWAPHGPKHLSHWLAVETGRKKEGKNKINPTNNCLAQLIEWAVGKGFIPGWIKPKGLKMTRKNWLSTSHFCIWLDLLR